MKGSILVYGVGVIGSVYALRFAKAGFAVTTVARGERLASLRAGGLTIRQIFLDEEESAELDVVEAVPQNAEFDLVLVALRAGQIMGALEELKRRNVSGPVFVVGNNLGDGSGVGGYAAQAALIGVERLVLGFGAFGGYRDGGTIVYVDGRTRTKPGADRRSKTLVGVLSEGARPAMEKAKLVLGEALMPVEESPDIAAWFLCHAALVFPLCGAMYAAGGDQARFCRTRDALVLGVRACKEAFRALRALGVGLEPKKLHSLLSMPEWILIPMLGKGFRGEGARVAMFGHANAPGGRDEIGTQVLVLDGILRKAGRPLPAWERLLSHFAAQGGPSLIPAGSRELRLRLW